MRVASRSGLAVAAVLAVGATGTALAAPASAAATSLVTVYVSATLTCSGSYPTVFPTGDTAKFAKLVSTSSSGTTLTRKYSIQLDTSVNSSQLAAFGGQCLSVFGGVVRNASGSVRVYTSPAGKTYAVTLT